MSAMLRKLAVIALLIVFVLIGFRAIGGLSTTTTSPSTSTTTKLGPTPVGGGTGRIAFAVFDKPQIYTSNADGTDLVHLADISIDPWQFQWAPDGAHFALRSMEGDIYVIKADGSNLIRLAETKGVGFFSWSPDGRKIVFDSYDNADSGFLRGLQLYSINIDGTGLTQITHGTDNHGKPAWSPDGTQIAFQFTTDPFVGDYELHLINADGSGEVNIASEFDYSQDILWSPDGKQLLTASGNPIQLYVLNADGSQRKQLTHTTGHNLQPSWSPDGKRIVFTTSNKDSGSRIHIINADGSDQKEFPDDPDTADGYAAWSPDGQWITYTATRIKPEANCCTSCCVNVYIVKSDGSGWRRLTNEIESSWYAIWQP